MMPGPHDLPTWESSAVTYRRLPLRAVAGSGSWLIDDEGNRYLDCLAGAGATALGHDHPAIRRALVEVIESGAPLTTLDLATPLRSAFVDELLQVLPPSFERDGKVHFCSPSGANAVEAAVTLLSFSTGRRDFLAFRGGYHGSTWGARALSGSAGLHASAASGAFPVTFLPYPDSYRCPFGVGGDAGARMGLDYIRQVLADGRSGSAGWGGLVAEFVQGEGGSVPPPAWWIGELGDLTAEHGIPLVADEVQVGLGRTGRMWAFEHGDVEPDVIVASKALGGGLPLAVMVYRSAHDGWPEGTFTGTFRGSALALAAGAAALRTIREEKLADAAAARGTQLLAELQEVARGVPGIGDVRGRGLVLGVEIVDPGAWSPGRGVPAPDPATARAVRRGCLDHGLLVELGGPAGNVVRFLPPLILTDGEASSVVDRFATAVQDCTSSTSS